MAVELIAVTPRSRATCFGLVVNVGPPIVRGAVETDCDSTVSLSLQTGDNYSGAGHLSVMDRYQRVAQRMRNGSRRSQPSFTAIIMKQAS
jgi:hypothetical protein